MEKGNSQPQSKSLSEFEKILIRLDNAVSDNRDCINIATDRVASIQDFREETCEGECPIPSNDFISKMGYLISRLEGNNSDLATLNRALINIVG